MVVTVTPLAVEKDSRTFKQAASISRFGYMSLVFEGQGSELELTILPFTLQSIKKTKPKKDNKRVEDHQVPKRKEGYSTVIKRLTKSQFWELLHFFYDRIYQYGLRTFWKIPKAQLYYLHAFYQFPAVYLLCRLYKVPYIYDAHDFYSRIQGEEKLNWLQKRIIVPFDHWLETNCVKKAADIITVSDGIADLQMQEFGRRGTVIRNCQDPRIDIVPIHDLRDGLKLGEKDFLLVVIGQAKPGQAIIEAIDAMSQLPGDVHIAFLGNNYLQYIPEGLDTHLFKRIHIVPPVKPSEVVNYIKNADASLILYYPYSINYYYSLPNSFFQSVNAGLPILYPENLPEIRKIAELYQIGLPINPQSPTSIRNAVRKLIQSSEELSIYRKNLLRASQELNWEHEEKILEKLINHVLYPVNDKEVVY
jgi:glycosyltransferase involved in cell wall biosynthesis